MSGPVPGFRVIAFNGLAELCAIESALSSNMLGPVDRSCSKSFT